MDDGEDKVESPTEVSNASSSENYTIAGLKSQIDELKRELETVRKKLHKAEFERDNAQKNSENLKSEVKALSKKLQEERKKNAERKGKNNGEQIQGSFLQKASRAKGGVGVTYNVAVGSWE